MSRIGHWHAKRLAMVRLPARPAVWPSSIIVEDTGYALWYAHAGSGATPISGSIAALAATFIGRSRLRFLTGDRSHA